MSYPSIVLHGDEGEQFAVYAATDQRWPLGTQLVMQDGRKYRFARAGGATLVIGDLLTAAANASSDVDVTAIAAAVGSRGPTAITTNPTVVNRYAEGYMNVSVAPGAGQVYCIDNHLAGTTAAITFNLAAGHAIRVALTTTSRLDFIANPYKSVIQAPVTTTTAAPVGVAVSAPTTTKHCWIQTAGMASVLTSGTVVLGAPVNNIQVAGSVGPPENTTVATLAKQLVVGICQRVSANTAWSDIKLTLE